MKKSGIRKALNAVTTVLVVIVVLLAVALVGGNTINGASCGACVNLYNAASNAYWGIGGSPSCEEPLAA